MAGYPGMSYEWHDYSDREMLAIDLAQQIAGGLRQALGHKDRVLLAVPGGTSPGPVFDDLCAAELDWSRVDVVLTDERWVPDAHIRSNARMLREHLLVERAAKANFLPLYRRAERPEDVLDEVAATLAPCLPINVLLLGMGEDMHTASLFPGAEGLELALSSDAPILVPMRGGETGETRVTLSARVLDDAVSKHVVITGAKKRAALERAQNKTPQQAPIRAVMDEATVHWAE